MFDSQILQVEPAWQLAAIADGLCSWTENDKKQDGLMDAGGSFQPTRTKNGQISRLWG